MRKPNGYYKPFENVKQELTTIIQELSHFPTQIELKEKGLNSLATAISKCHGGFPLVREKMNTELLRKPNRHYEDFENVEKELTPIIQELGHFPTQNELNERGLSGLVMGILRCHKGLNAVRVKMGYEPLQKPNGYYESFENIEKELNPVIKELGHFPTAKELEEKRLSGLKFAIIKHHKGLNAARKRMGYEPLQKPNGYYESFENIEKELNPVIKELGHFPTHQELGEMGLSGLIGGIYNHHKGLNAARKRMGYEPLQKPDRYYEFFENIEKELNPVIQQLGHFPTHRELLKKGLSGLVNGIHHNHKGLNSVKNRMGYELSHKLKDNYKSWETVEKELTPIINGLGHFPTHRELLKKGLSGLVRGIYKYHAGLNAVREKMGFNNETKELENLLSAYVGDGR